MYWVWENYVRDVLTVRKLCKRCTESVKIMWDALIVRKICKRCTESVKIM